MTALTIDPVEGVVKVTTLPEKPIKKHEIETYAGTLYLGGDFGYEKAMQKYQLALEQAVSTAIIVKDQKQGLLLCWENDPDRSKTFEEWMKREFVHNELYPIPGLKYTVERIERFEEFCSDEYIITEEVAILSLEEERPEEPCFKIHGSDYFCEVQCEECKSRKPVSDGEYCNCHFAMIMRNSETDVAYCAQCKKEINEGPEAKPVDHGETEQKKIFDAMFCLYFNRLKEGGSEYMATKEVEKHFTIQRKVKQ